MTKQAPWILVLCFCAFTLVQAADQYVQNQYTGKLDNVGIFRDYSAKFVPYTGAKKTVNLIPYGLKTKSIHYATYSTFEPTEHGATYWNPAKGTLDINMGYDSVVQQVGMEQYYPPVRAKTATIPNGQVVMVDPLDILSGERFNAIPAVADGTYSARLMLGMATMDIPHNQTGYVTRFGEVHGLSLSALKPGGETWVAGEILWVNPTVPGGLTDTEPSAPNLKLAVAVVQKVSGNDLDLFVRFEYAPSISELHDVYTNGLSYHDFLVYNSVAGRWENKAAVDIPEVTNSPKFTNNSTYTAAHIRSVSPYGGHPAAGSNRQVQYNNYGTPAGAAQLNYSGSRFGIGTTSPTYIFHVASSAVGKATSSLGSSTNYINMTQDGLMVSHAYRTPQIKVRSTATNPDGGGIFLSDGENNFVIGSGLDYASGTYTAKASTRRGEIVATGSTGITFFHMSSASVGGTSTALMNTRFSPNATCIGSPKFCYTGDGKFGMGTSSPRSPFDNASSARGKGARHNGSSGNYVYESQDLGVRLKGNATTWDDLRVEPTARSGAGIGTAPAFATSPWDTLLFNYKYVNSPSAEYLYYNVQMPHNWLEGSSIYPHLHFVPHTTGTGQVDFTLYCSWATPTGTFGAGSAYTVSYNIVSNSQYKHLMAANATPVSMSGLAGSAIASCYVTRSMADTYAGDVSLLYIDIHYEIDSMGSDDRTTKTATP